MESGILISVILPASLFFIMFGMGMGLTPTDFRQVFAQPKAFTVGISAQMIGLPITCLIITHIFSLPPLLAIGLMIVSFCPGGTVSNMYSYLTKGDTALSISLTAVISLITPFTIPILINLSSNYWEGETATVSLPIVATIIQLLIITVLPVGLGMLLNHFKPQLCERSQAVVKVASVTLLFLIIAAFIKQNAEYMLGYFQQVGIPALCLNILAMALGFALSKLFSLNSAQSITISYEVGIQNGTTALLITSTILQSVELSTAPVVYGLLMFVTGTLFGLMIHFLTNKRRTAEDKSI